MDELEKKRLEKKADNGDMQARARLKRDPDLTREELDKQRAKGWWG